jgi:hypothetical protein
METVMKTADQSNVMRPYAVAGNTWLATAKYE